MGFRVWGLGFFLGVLTIRESYYISCGSMGVSESRGTLLGSLIIRESYYVGVYVSGPYFRIFVNPHMVRFPKP